MAYSKAFVMANNALKQKIKENTIEVPMLPEVPGKVVRLTQNPESDALELALLIQSDQTLAGHVMKVANSAAYSPNSSMVSLQQAVARLGIRVIADIALATSIKSALFNTPGFEKHIAYEIKYSLASGLWAKEVARACRKNVEAAFLSGLLHDIGRPVAIQTTLDICKELSIQLTREEVLKLEHQYQRAIGIRVIQQWEMPTSVLNVICYFKNYHDAHNEQHLTMSVVAGAMIASHFMCEADENKECKPVEELFAEHIFSDLNLYQDDIEQILERSNSVLETLEKMSS